MQQLQEDLPREKQDNAQEPDKKRDALKAIIEDYNSQYGTNHQINQFDLYYQDVQKRIKDQQYPSADLSHDQKIDVTIVVDMLLTGFDSKYLNTLYVDKNLKYHGLIQAFSRTNRVLNDSKPWGNILDFRNQQDAVDKAISLFSGEHVDRAKQIWLVDPAPKVIDQYAQAVKQLDTFMQAQGLEAKPDQVGDLERCALRPGNVHSAHGWRDVLVPVVERYKGRAIRLYFRGDAAFASPEIYDYLEAEGMLYAIRLPANKVLQESIAHLLKRPVGRPPTDVRRYHASFSYQAGTWDKPRRVVAKVEWHPGELYPRVGFIVTNLGRPAERVVAFYNQRGTAEQWIKEGKNAIRWTRLSCRRFDHNAVRLQLHALAYNLGNFMRTLALPDAVEQWSLTSLREKLIKIGAKIVRHGRYVTFQMAEVVIPRDLFADILRRIDRLRPPPAPA